MRQGTKPARVKWASRASSTHINRPLVNRTVDFRLNTFFASVSLNGTLLLSLEHLKQIRGRFTFASRPLNDKDICPSM